MPSMIISPQTIAVESRPFRVRAEQLPLGVSSTGLAGSEVMTLKRKQADGTFRALTSTGATMSASDQDTVIDAVGTYLISKPATAGNAGASIG